MFHLPLLRRLIFNYTSTNQPAEAALRAAILYYHHRLLMPADDIARILGYSQSTIESRLQRLNGRARRLCQEFYLHFEVPDTVRFDRHQFDAKFKCPVKRKRERKAAKAREFLHAGFGVDAIQVATSYANWSDDLVCKVERSLRTMIDELTAASADPYFAETEILRIADRLRSKKDSIRAYVYERARLEEWRRLDLHRYVYPNKFTKIQKADDHGLHIAAKHRAGPVAPTTAGPIPFSISVTETAAA